MRYRLIISCFCCFILFSALASSKETQVIFCGSTKNDLYKLLDKEKIKIKRYNSPAIAIAAASRGAAVFIVADSYPDAKVEISPALLKAAKDKQLKLYIEYPASLPGFDIPNKPVSAKLERGIITSNIFGDHLPPMSILGINDCHVLPVNVSDPLIVLAKVAGLDRAEYGIDDVQTYPLLFEKENMLIAMTKLSNFATGRYGPDEAWKQVWTHILSRMTGNEDFQLNHWPTYVSPMYTRDEPLPKKAKAKSIEKGVEWFYNGRFFIHPVWKDMWLKYQGDGSAPFGPPVNQDLPNGDGTLGLLEGHASNIYYDGTQQYRYWVRADVQGEAGYALAAAGKFLEKRDYSEKAKNLIDFIFYNSNLRSNARSDKNSASYGLIGWSVTHPGVFYGDDNARTILGILGASAYMDTDKWNKEVVEAIMANFRTTGKHGFRGSRLEEKDIQKYGWEHFWERDIKNPAPHYESWIWACYLWLYDKTGYEPLLAKAKNAIRITMENYPDQWRWTNGIQQERARMILPLAWLVRVEDTEEHRRWLDVVVTKLLENQVESGAIREELGTGKGRYGRTASNKEYGLHEAPLIFKNGDPIADMLYTSNFAFFSLNEAAHATGNKEYKKAVDKLSDFLTRIQVKSNKYNDLDGAWFRAFEYDRWEYWASNADVGWGAWGTLTGWTQSWIVATQVLNAQNQNYWDLTRESTVNEHMQHTIDVMFKDKVNK
jgi:hypothetical protein